MHYGLPVAQRTLRSPGVPHGVEWYRRMAQADGTGGWHRWMAPVDGTGGWHRRMAQVDGTGWRVYKEIFSHYQTPPNMNTQAPTKVSEELSPEAQVILTKRFLAMIIDPSHLEGNEDLLLSMTKTYIESVRHVVEVAQAKKFSVTPREKLALLNDIILKTACMRYPYNSEVFTILTGEIIDTIDNLKDKPEIVDDRPVIAFERSTTGDFHL